jgi:pilus assembly protein Flp/PilA
MSASDPFTQSSRTEKEKCVFKNFASMLINDGGQGLVEYALIIALVSIVAMAALRSLGNSANNTLQNTSNQLS